MTNKVDMKVDIVGYEHLHLHTDFSLLDGLGLVEEYALRAPTINQKFLTISDHGMLGAVPRQIRACEKICDKYGKDTLSPIFACELYLNPMQPQSNSLEDMQKFMADLNDDEIEKIKPSYHLLAIAINETGYKNLVRLSSWGWVNGFYRRPRINYEELLKHKEGIVFTSCCYASEIGKAFDKGGEDAGYDMVEKYIAMFGKDHFYLEIMLLDFNKQKPYDAFILKAKERYGLKLILTNDVHYCQKEDSKYQRLMLMIQTNRTVADIEKALKEDGTQDLFELQDTNLWMKSEEELNQKWLSDYSDIIPYEIFTEAKLTTVELCHRAKGVTLDRSLKLPVITDCDEKLREEVKKGFISRRLPQSKEYLSRLKEEYSLITRKGFSSYFLIQKMMTDEARRVCRDILGYGDGSQAVGFGRGCLEGSVLVYGKHGMPKPISDIKKGEEVYTRDGSLQKVINTANYPVDEELLTIFTYYGDNRGVSLTKDHKVLVEKTKYVEGYEIWSESTKKSRKKIVEPTGNLSWTRADQISVGDWVFVPVPESKSKELENIDLSQYCNGKNLTLDHNMVYQDWLNPLTGKLRKRKICCRFIDAKSDIFWMLVGIFAGDGWFRSDGSNKIGFAIHSLDAFNLALMKKFASDMLLDFTITTSSTKKLTQFHINNAYIRFLFGDLFDRYKCTPETKHVPDIVFSLPDQLKWAFLRGYFLSDGHQGIGKISFDTKSLELASQIRFLLLSLGVPSSLNYGDRFDKRTNKKSFCYKINTPVTSFLGFSDDCKSHFYRKISGGILLQVRKIKTKKEVKRVYDIEVENNSNYLTSSFLVHNSAVGALTCYCLGITNVDPVREGLLFSRFMSEARGGRSLVLEFKNIDPLPADESFI